MAPPLANEPLYPPPSSWPHRRRVGTRRRHPCRRRPAEAVPKVAYSRRRHPTGHDRRRDSDHPRGRGSPYGTRQPTDPPSLNRFPGTAPNERTCPKSQGLRRSPRDAPSSCSEVTRVAKLEHASILRFLTCRHDDLIRHHPVGMKSRSELSTQRPGSALRLRRRAYGVRLNASTASRTVG